MPLSQSQWAGLMYQCHCPTSLANVHTYTVGQASQGVRVDYSHPLLYVGDVVLREGGGGGGGAHDMYIHE